MGRTSERVLWLLLVVLVAARAEACLWDADTLRQEMRGLPGVAEVIVGAFERLPVAFYEERVLIASERLAAGDAALGTYDDAAVACDRLGRHVEALDWLASKRAALDELPEPNLEHEYRYHANLGTVLAHRWLSCGADREDLAGLRAARDEIARAIEINPDAHFGREVVQLAVLDWLLVEPDALVPIITERRFRSDPDRADSWPPRPSLARFLSATVGRERAVEGLVGMMVMGGAWESPDVLAALCELTLHQHHLSIAGLARFRLDELLANGHVPLRLDAWEFAGIGDPLAAFAEAGPRPESSIAFPEHLEDDYARWRERVAYFERERQAWVRRQLAAGDHPDRLRDLAAVTAYWAAAPQPPSIQEQSRWRSLITTAGALRLTAVASVLSVLVATPAGFVLGRWVRRRAGRAPVPSVHEPPPARPDR